MSHCGSVNFNAVDKKYVDYFLKNRYSKKRTMNDPIGTKKHKEEIALLDEGWAWNGAPHRVFFAIRYSFHFILKTIILELP